MSTPKKIKTAKAIANLIQKLSEQIKAIEIPKELAQKLAKIPSLDGASNKQQEFITNISTLEEIVAALKEAANKKHRSKVKELSEAELAELLPAKKALQELERILQSEDFGLQCDSQLIAAEERFLKERKRFRNPQCIREIYRDSIFGKGDSDE